MALTTPPELLPYSAPRVLVRTENSRMASTPRFTPWTEPPGLLLGSVLITSPTTMNRFEVGRPPETVSNTQAPWVMFSPGSVVFVWPAGTPAHSAVTCCQPRAVRVTSRDVVLRHS